MTLRRVHVTIIAVEKQLSITYVCVFMCVRAWVGVVVRVGARAQVCAYARVSSLIQHATRMRHIASSL